jgi:hypothetical protein
VTGIRNRSRSRSDRAAGMHGYELHSMQFLRQREHTWCICSGRSARMQSCKRGRMILDAAASWGCWIAGTHIHCHMRLLLICCRCEPRVAVAWTATGLSAVLAWAHRTVLRLLFFAVGAVQLKSCRLKSPLFLLLWFAGGP